MSGFLVSVPALVALACGSADEGTSAAGGFDQITTCLAGPTEELYDCYDAFLNTYTAENGQDTAALLATLETARVDNSTIANNCHALSHAIGRWTYQQLGNIADSFQACDQTCSAGCFHGVMERLFLAEAEGGSDTHISYDEIRFLLPELCLPENLNTTDQTKIFQCLHGLGHAVLYGLNYDLNVSLMSCDVLLSDYDRESCYGGVFMENVTAYDPSLRDLDPNDPLYPCTAVGDIYRRSCYLIQPDAMSDAQLTAQEIGAACLRAGSFVDVCMQGLGRVYSSRVIAESWGEILPVCEEYAPGYEHACISGVVTALVNTTGDGRYAYKYCNAVRPDLQTTCYDQSNSYLTLVFGYTAAEVVEQCEQHAWVGQSLCLSQI